MSLTWIVLAFSVVQAGATANFFKLGVNGPVSWDAGSNCLLNLSKLMFEESKAVTQSVNVVLNNSLNMSTSVYHILYYYLKSKSAYSKNRVFYRFQIISDDSESLPDPAENNWIIRVDMYIMIVESVERLRNFVENFLRPRVDFRPNALFIVLYNNFHEKNQSIQVANEIFRILLRDSSTRVVVLYSTGETSYDILASETFSAKSCGSVNAKKVTTCDRGIIKNAAFSKFAISSMFIPASIWNCTLKLCARISVPYIYDTCNEGLEYEIVRAIKDKLKFKMIRNCTYEDRGILLPNGSWTNLLSKLDRKECDFLVGGFYPDNEVNQYFGSTDAYFTDSYTWFINEAAYRPPWEGVIGIYSTHVWLCIISTVFISTIFWYIFANIVFDRKQYIGLEISALNAFGSAFGVSIEKPNCSAQRFFFISLAFYSIIINSLFTSQLTSVFANPRKQHQISDIEEVIEKEIPFGGRSEFQDWFQNDVHKEIFELYNTSDVFRPQTENLERVARGEIVMLVNEKFVLGFEKKDQLYGFATRVFSSPLEMITRRGFPFDRKFNSILFSLIEAGILEKFNEDFQHNMSYLRLIRQSRPNFQPRNVVLTIEHLAVAFFVLLIGLSLSSLVFICEVEHARDTIDQEVQMKKKRRLRKRKIMKNEIKARFQKGELSKGVKKHSINKSKQLIEKENNYFGHVI